MIGMWHCHCYKLKQQLERLLGGPNQSQFGRSYGLLLCVISHTDSRLLLTLPCCGTCISDTSQNRCCTYACWLIKFILAGMTTAGRYDAETGYMNAQPGLTHRNVSEPCPSKFHTRWSWDRHKGWHQSRWAANLATAPSCLPAQQAKRVKTNQPCLACATLHAKAQILVWNGYAQSSMMPGPHQMLNDHIHLMNSWQTSLDTASRMPGSKSWQPTWRLYWTLPHTDEAKGRQMSESWRHVHIRCMYHRRYLLDNHAGGMEYASILLSSLHSQSTPHHIQRICSRHANDTSTSSRTQPQEWSHLTITAVLK